MLKVEYPKDSNCKYSQKHDAVQVSLGSNLKWLLLKMSQSQKSRGSYIEPLKTRVRLCAGVTHTCYPSTLKLRQDNPEFEVSGLHSKKLPQKTKKKLKIKNQSWSGGSKLGGSGAQR